MSILVLKGLTKQPRGVPILSSSVQKNCTSSSGTVEEISSMYANRCAMLPKPSSPGLPASSRDCARSCKDRASGLRTQCRTSVAKIGDSGHPWLTPSFM